MKTHTEAQATLVNRLRQEGWNVAPDALDPLQDIDFEKLVDIHDHEEHFLEETFFKTLIALRDARASTQFDQGMITGLDVGTALRMLGAAIPRQMETTLSSSSKAAIKSACGFC